MSPPDSTQLQVTTHKDTLSKRTGVRQVQVGSKTNFGFISQDASPEQKFLFTLNRISNDLITIKYLIIYIIRYFFKKHGEWKS